MIDADGQASNVNVKRTSATTEDDGGAAGWSIADSRLWRAATNTDWNNETGNFLRLAVYGTANAGVTAVALSSTPASGTTYGPGEEIAVQLTFSTAVDVTGTPRLEIDLGASDERWAEYESGSTTTVLTFVYTVVATDSSTGIAVLAKHPEVEQRHDQRRRDIGTP